MGKDNAGAEVLHSLIERFFSYLDGENTPIPPNVRLEFERKPYLDYRSDCSKARQTTILQIVELASSLGYTLDKKDVSSVRNGGDVSTCLRVIAELEKQLPKREELRNIEVINPFE